MFAIDLLTLREPLLTADDLPMLEQMLRTSLTWAYVDSLAASVVGPLVERHPELVADLDRWATDDDFWIRRSALLAWLGPLRRGEGDLDRFLRYADSMLDEKEFFIRKAIGWVLRETAKKRPAEVAEYLAARIDRVSGLTLREAIRHLPERERAALLEAYKRR
jgi:3-methyladenine DNA glycosylase AlkD